MNELLSETGLSSAEVDALQWGCAKQVKEQGNGLARIIALLSDLGEVVPGTMIDRLSGSSAQAIVYASDSNRSGFRDCVIAGGVENMSRIERNRSIDSYPGIREQYDVDSLQMGMTAEAVAERFDISREAYRE